MEKIKTISNDKINANERNEENTKKTYITPVLDKLWGDSFDARYIMEYVISDGRVKIEGNESKRTSKKRVDYLLCVKNNIPIAVLEAKSIDKPAFDGYQQAIDYATKLEIPFAYSTNGIDLIEEDLITGKNRTIKMSEMPGPEELWQRYLQESESDIKGTDVISYPDYYDPSKPWKKPRYYQRISINRVLQGIAEGKKRMLLCLATGTGKTYTVFQIAWKLYRTGTKKKILYLVDRTALATQTMQKDFKPFVDLGIMKQMNRKTIIQDTAYEVFVALYQQLIDKKHDYYKELPADFFDLIIIDECHRGSADVNGNWHKMLDYFSSATQIGLTATPKETEDVSNIAYFCQETDGKPIYTYSLKQGIEDGYLAPYKVISVELNIDKEGYRPLPGELDIEGNPVENRVYTRKEFDRKIVVDNRRETIAQKITDYLIENNCRYSKTIVFCEDRAHAAAMTTLLKSKNEDLVKENPKYIRRIVSNDGEEEVENFTDPNCKYPVIAITSKLLSTGVDTETVELIVLDKTIGSQTEFKQTVGRGTRIKEEFEIDNNAKSKLNFTILDFRGNYVQFQDPNFDGEPVSVLKINEGDKFTTDKKEKDKREDEEGDKKQNTRIKYHVIGGDVFSNNEEVRYLNEDGSLVRENLESCVKNNIISLYPSFESFKNAWDKATDKIAMANDLLMDMNFVENIRNNLKVNADKYDLICFLGYGIEPISKKQRIEKILQSYTFTSLQEEKKNFLITIFKEYEVSDFQKLKDLSGIFSLPSVREAGYTPITVIKQIFKTKEYYFALIEELEKVLYE